MYFARKKHGHNQEKTPIFTPDYIKENYSNFIEDSTYNITAPVYNNVMCNRAFVFNGKVHIFYMHKVYGMTADDKREMEEYLKKEGKEYTIKAGENFKFAKNGLHSVRAKGNFKMALLLTLE